MKFKYFIIIVFSFFTCIISVNASSITYNLNIAKDLKFNEDIIYKVNSNELDRSGNYDFLTSVVDDSIYFDNDSSVKYKKTKSYSNGVYTVHLKNNYSYLFLTNSRILKECFSTYDYDIGSEDDISISTESPFYCSHRADTITVNITTSLNVISNNATSVKGSTYTWTGINDEFSLNFRVATETYESSTSPMDDIEESESENQNNSEEANTNNSNTNANENQEEKSGISLMTVLIIVISLIIIISIITVILKVKSDKNNSL